MLISRHEQVKYAKVRARAGKFTAVKDRRWGPADAAEDVEDELESCDARSDGDARSLVTDDADDHVGECDCPFCNHESSCQVTMYAACLRNIILLC